ncbi:MAG: bifunctional UDP-N-acetylglucosamine diphosphorylase/glucosamine-1-phosphate N-acetyltransferase GlmU [Bacillota bacterium]|nr:bifunctional UDP-N-acetylglucosamine diphosphorylase/glucosamine-1-phosphate N-acetyltransferase GlmU [Bacillota bacterium]
MCKVSAAILAAGMGQRMRSVLPKVLHQVCGRPMCSLVREVLRDAGIAHVVGVVSPQGQAVRAALGADTDFVVQPQPLGTGDAVRYALIRVVDSAHVLVLYGDTPLLRPETVRSLVCGHIAAGPAVSMLTAEMDDPAGYGRVVRDPEGRLLEIVEQLQCTPQQAAIREANVGIYCVDRSVLDRYIPLLEAHPPQGEYLFTDIVGLVLRDGLDVRTVAADAEEVAGVNSRHQLAEAEAKLRRREVRRLMDSGVTVVDPATTYVDRGVTVGTDTVVRPHSYLLRGTAVGSGCTIGPGAYLDGATLADGVSVIFSTVEGSCVGPDCTIGPYAHLRPGTVLETAVKVGNFAEVKNSRLGVGTKVSHHSYVGDSDVGRDTNVGAGAVFVNYDGRDKHRTTVGDGAFIGCNVNLVAPVRVGDRSYVAAGSTITDEVPAESLAIARQRQRVILEWVRRRFGPAPDRPEEGRGHGGGEPGSDGF